jgi:hypothetical protein
VPAWVAVLKETVLPPALGPVELQAPRPAASAITLSCFTVLNMVGSPVLVTLDRWLTGWNRKPEATEAKSRTACRFVIWISGAEWNASGAGTLEPRLERSVTGVKPCDYDS